jgi:hypothetical protein
MHTGVYRARRECIGRDGSASALQEKDNARHSSREISSINVIMNRFILYGGRYAMTVQVSGLG